MLKRIHVNRHHIAHNRKAGKVEKPPFTVKTYRDNIVGYAVEIKGESTMVYNPDNPLKCGAVAWMETKGTVVVRGRTAPGLGYPKGRAWTKTIL